MSVWFTADPHLGGHRLATEHRGFVTPEGHDAHFAEQWRAVVHKDDTVWVLGDIAVSSPVNALALIGELPGTKHLIAGNHDRCHPAHRDAHNHQWRYLEVFSSVQPFARRKISGQDVLLSHFPYIRDRGPARFTQWRLPDHGLWLLHGHTHGPEQRTGREIHVGLDAWGMAPVNLRTIEELMGHPAT